jgi:hypothetical protein
VLASALTGNATAAVYSSEARTRPSMYVAQPRHVCGERARSRGPRQWKPSRRPERREDQRDLAASSVQCNRHTTCRDEEVWQAWPTVRAGGEGAAWRVAGGSGIEAQGWSTHVTFTSGPSRLGSPIEISSGGRSAPHTPVDGRFRRVWRRGLPRSIAKRKRSTAGSWRTGWTETPQIDFFFGREEFFV